MPHKDEATTDGYDIQDAINSAYSNYSIEDTAFIVRSNKRANQYNEQIRTKILDKESELSTGDFLMVVKINVLKTLLLSIGQQFLFLLSIFLENYLGYYPYPMLKLLVFCFVPFYLNLIVTKYCLIRLTLRIVMRVGNIF